MGISVSLSFFTLTQIMKKIWICAIFCLFANTAGNSAVQIYEPYINNLPFIQSFKDTMPSDSLTTKKLMQKAPIRNKSVQSKDYHYGKYNLLSFIFAMLSVFCLVLLFAIIPLQLSVVMVFLYLLHAVFIVLSFLKGLKGIKETKMKILGYIGLITSSCFGLTLLFGIGYLALILLLFILGG
jgi:VIT1/CCC1 family predicted Fe2+/Mn2+ transporter